MEKGDADYGYGSSLVVNYNISNHAYQEIATLPVSEEKSNYVCSFSKDASRELIAVVNEVIENVDSATMNSYLLESSQIGNQALLSSWIRKNPVRAMGIVAAFVVLVDVYKRQLQETTEALMDKGYCVSGIAEEVDGYCEGKNVIGYDELGNLKLAYVQMCIRDRNRRLHTKAVSM